MSKQYSYQLVSVFKEYMPGRQCVIDSLYSFEMVYAVEIIMNLIQQNFHQGTLNNNSE